MRYLIAVEAHTRDVAKLILTDNGRKVAAVFFKPEGAASFKKAHTDLCEKSQLTKQAGIAQGAGGLFVEGSAYAYPLLKEFKRQLEQKEGK